MCIRDSISTEGVKALTRHLIAKGVKGVYVGGSSGECIYQHVDAVSYTHLDVYKRQV